MEGIRGEVSNKIRSAIKAKLMELGAYVDDELPDYIMVMVANKRSRQQMEEDLTLFLGDSTSTFTAWLHTVLSKLQQVTVNNSELKKVSEKKRPSAEDHKKEKRKKIKKEKDKPEKAENIVEKGKAKDGVSEEKNVLKKDTQFEGKPIKSEPADLIVDEESLLTGNSSRLNNQYVGSNSSGTQEKRSSELRTNEDDDDDDFINLKADVEADMWGEGDETATVSAKICDVPESAPLSSVSTETRSVELTVQETVPEQSEKPTPSIKSVNSISPEEVSATHSVSPSKHVESRPAPRIIRISEAIRQEQETLKPASKVVRDPQALAKRVFQSHIVSLKNAQDKADKSKRQSSSSHLTDSHSRRNDQRGRKHEHEDLRETLRKERQKERGHGRDRERERRRSRDSSQVQKSQAAAASALPRSPLSHKDENGPDPALLSVVRVKPRPQVPAALQANRSLILKAVAEAQKSVSKVLIRSELVSIKSRLSKKPLKETHQQSKSKSQSPSKKGQLNSKQQGCLPSRDKLRKLSFTVLGTKAVPSKESVVADFGDVTDEGSIILDPSLNILIQVPASPAVEETNEPQDPIQTEKVRRWIEDVEEATKSEIIPPEVVTELGTDLGTDVDTFAGIESASKQASEEEFEDTLEVDTNSLKTSDIHSVVISEDQPVRQSTGTQFVVTLDGLDPRLLRSFALEGDTLDSQASILAQHQVPDSQDEENLVDEENLLREELVKEQLLRQELLRQQAAIREQKANLHSKTALSSAATLLHPSVKRPASPCSSMEARPSKVISTQAKSSNAERCKFWPSCKNGDSCDFHHPSVPCKLFPNCKFSDRCLYIHPNCRFNTACTRADCPYTHTGPRSTHNTPPAGTNHMISQSMKQACKYFPNCSNLSCPYIHPTVCKFGTHCTRPKCQFIHSDKGLITKHKWVRQ